jgi:hypothetical protein
VGYEELLDGDEHWLEAGLWPGWVRPHLVTGELVKQTVYVPDELEVPMVAIVVLPVPETVLNGTWGEDGWSQLSIMLQALCALLDLPVDVQQVVKRDSAWNVTGKWHKVHAGATAGGLAAGDLLDTDEIAALTEGL